MALRKRKANPAVEEAVKRPAAGKAKAPSRAVAVKAEAKAETKAEGSKAGKMGTVVQEAALDAAGLDKAIAHVAKSDAKLARLIEQHGLATCLVGEATKDHFKSLVRSIVYQQLAGKAASAIYGRFLELVGGEDGVIPGKVVGLDPGKMRGAGLSERKSSYILDLAAHFADGRLCDATINSLSDTDLMTTLTAVRGIGPWSVHMHMMFRMGRPDVLPVGDYAVRRGFQILYGLKTLPDAARMEELSAPWRPYRSVGAYYMWRVTDGEKKGAGKS